MRRAQIVTESPQPDFADINIIPLVDILLVLLIIVMVAAPLSVSGIGVHLPESKARGTSLDESRIMLSVDARGDYYFDTVKVDQANLEAKLQAIFSTRTQKDLYIRADRRVSYSAVIDAMSAAKLAGVTKVAMLTSPPTQAPR